MNIHLIISHGWIARSLPAVSTLADLWSEPEARRLTPELGEGSLGVRIPADRNSTFDPGLTPSPLFMDSLGVCATCGGVSLKGCRASGEARFSSSLICNSVALDCCEKLGVFWVSSRAETPCRRSVGPFEESSDWSTALGFDGGATGFDAGACCRVMDAGAGGRTGDIAAESEVEAWLVDSSCVGPGGSSSAATACEDKLEGVSLTGNACT
jgi:hypothetical protein